MAASPNNHVRVHAEPRITANELARYMLAQEPGKIGIIKQNRTSSTAQRIRYTDARQALRASLINPRRARATLESAAERFRQRAGDPSSTSFVVDDSERSLEVLTAFEALQNQMAGYQYEAAPQSCPPLMISGVRVACTIDAFVRPAEGNRGGLGGLIFRLTKPSEDETEAAATRRREMGQYVATLIRMQIQQNFESLGDADHRLCWSVDVQSAGLYPAPKAVSP